MTQSLPLALSISALVALSGICAAQEAPPAPSNPGGNFTPALPLNLDTCAQTAAISQYLDSIAPDDVQKLKELRSYLEGCQKLLEDRVVDIKQQIEEIEAQDAPDRANLEGTSAPSQS